MDIIDKELESRRGEIKTGLKILFELNFHITGWDIPELDEEEAVKRLFNVIEEELAALKKEKLGAGPGKEDE